MTLLFGVEVLIREIREAEGRTADPSTALRFGRDDKGEGGASIWGLRRGMVNSLTAVGIFHVFAEAGDLGQEIVSFRETGCSFGGQLVVSGCA
jgi:hypothetical protein